MLKGRKAAGCKASPGTQLGVARDKRRRRLKNGDDALAGRQGLEEDLDRKMLRDTSHRNGAGNGAKTAKVQVQRTEIRNG